MKELTLEITNYCDKQCPWCSSFSHNYGKPINFNKIVEYITTYRKTCDSIRLSGGEPTSHPDFVKIVEKAKELEYEYIIILTSGTRKSARIIDGVSYIVSMIDSDSFEFVRSLKFFYKPVSMQVVMANGNEDNFLKSVQLSIQEKILLRLLKVQVQGRAELMGREYPYWRDGWDMPLISWTGDEGCNKDNKITITNDGQVVTCSALKYKDKCDLLDESIIS